MYMTNSKLVVALSIGIGGLCSGVSLTMALFVTIRMVIIRWSPAMLPYRIFGDKDKLMELEMNNSIAYLEPGFAVDTFR